MSPARPSRPIAAGDVVAVYSEALGEWTAAQITGVDATEKRAAVVELDWSGPRPSTAADLGDVQPLRLTHHSWNGNLSYSNLSWDLPRSYTVIGSLPVLVPEPSPAYSSWRCGDQLAMQRYWDAGNRESWTAPYALTCSADELAARVPDPGIRHLDVHGVTELDCARLVADYPDLTRLELSGTFGTLTSAAALNELPKLQRLWIRELFGMAASDCALPRNLPELEDLFLYNIPAEYAVAMRKAWRPEIPHGVCVDVRGSRKPEWVAENAGNPLRHWDGSEHIPRTAYRKAVAQYKATRKAFLAEVTGGAGAGEVAGVTAVSNPAEVTKAVEVATGEDFSAITQIGRDYAAAFNAMTRRTSFIETVERDELFDALDTLVNEAQTLTGKDLAAARAALIDGADEVRDW
ncbi:hypothetical protein [Yinghuangia soli]|uniref:Uncharacterized protein n=1 Tax=Yinghuangia soli TaxID=2908204 RepID=A0AA41PY56_9ACTN|nr:hypothetical protein [Yinghuangia soli]MCF2526974.1 hypothetical protein [Yinghuangia soli]